MTEQLSEFVVPELRIIGRMDRRLLLKLAGDRVERRVGVQLRTLKCQDLRRSIGLLWQTLPHFRDKPRFPDTGLALDQDELTLSLARGVPAGQEGSDFLLAANERQRRGLPCFETAGKLLADDLPGWHRVAKSFDGLWAEIPIGKVRRRELLGLIADDDRIRLRQGLQFRREIWGLADSIVVHGCLQAGNGAHENQACSDANPDVDLDILFSAEPMSEFFDFLDQFEPGANGAFRIVFMR